MYCILLIAQKVKIRQKIEFDLKMPNLASREHWFVGDWMTDAIPYFQNRERCISLAVKRISPECTNVGKC